MYRASAMRRAPVAIALCLLLASTAGASDTSGPDDHAPIGVMGDHMHHAGEVMLSYRYSRMRMDGNRTRTRNRSVSDVLADFPITPVDMDMQMHMIGAMWAPWEWLTTMAMLPIVSLSMDHENRLGQRFETNATGLGDVKLSGLVKLFARDGHKAHLNLGLSFPTGSIDESDTVLTPMGAMRLQLPYPMQLGSGSLDVMPGATYLGKAEGLSWGAQAMGTIRTYKNSNRYKLGDRVDLTAWLAKPWTPWLSTSLRTQWSYWGNVRGADPDLNPNAVPTADPDRRAGWRLDFLPGINLIHPGTGHRLAIEVGFPAAQWLDGPQLETDWRLVLGWQKAFDLFGG